MPGDDDTTRRSAFREELDAADTRRKERAAAKVGGPIFGNLNSTISLNDGTSLLARRAPDDGDDDKG